MASKMNPLSILLPLDSLKLGRLIVNRESPQQDFLDPPTTKEPGRTIQTEENFQGSLKDNESFGFGVKLANALNLAYDKGNQSSIEISAIEARTYEIQNSRLWFEEACSLPSVREWLERSVRQYGRAYLVVGYGTLMDATIKADFEKTGHNKAEAKAALDSAIFGFTGASTLVEGAIGLSSGNEKGLKQDFFARGENIYTVAYRKVKFRWFASRNVSDSFLEDKTQWKIYGSMRGSETEETAETADAVEAYLVDDTKDSESGSETDDFA